MRDGYTAAGSGVAVAPGGGAGVGVAFGVLAGRRRAAPSTACRRAATPACRACSCVGFFGFAFWRARTAFLHCFFFAGLASLLQCLTVGLTGVAPPPSDASASRIASQLT